jgi:hypothetical protein
MTVMYRPALPLPPSFRHFMDEADAIARAEGWQHTGRHYSYEPDAAELARIAEAESHRNIGFVFPVEALHLRKIDHDGKDGPTWTLFRSHRYWWEPETTK